MILGLTMARRTANRPRCTTGNVTDSCRFSVAGQQTLHSPKQLQRELLRQWELLHIIAHPILTKVTLFGELT